MRNGPRASNLVGRTMHQINAQTTPEPPIRQLPALRWVEPLPEAPGSPDVLDLGALADLATASGVDLADRARAALAPLLAHDALVLVPRAAPELPAQSAGPRGLAAGLSAIDWRRAVEVGGTAADGGAVRLRLASLDAALDIAGWAATCGRVTVSLV